jgi:hypothetical protein
MTQVTASLKVKKIRGGPRKIDGVVTRDSHCIYHLVLTPSKNDPGYGLSESKENAGRPRIKKMEWCPETVTHCIYHPVLPPRKNDPGYGLSEGKENAGRPG